jgi:transposase
VSDAEPTIDAASAANVATSTTSTEEWRGTVLDVLRKLLEGHEHDATVLAIFEKLVARNNELELQLVQMLSRGRKNEGISAAQLRLFLEALDQGRKQADDESDPAGVPCTPAVDEANTRLREVSGIDAKCRESEPEPPKPPRQPSTRGAFPEHLSRVPNPIAVPDDERPCPKCGNERECIGHETTEVAELEPAKVFIRVDIREKLMCKPCGGELVRAPAGDKVVSGGCFGPMLVGQLLIDKYSDGLPLHRQKERFERMGLPIAVSTLADQVTWATDLLRPLERAARRRVLGAIVMHVDGTGLPVLTRDKKTHKKIGKGKKLGVLWGYTGDDTALFLYCSTGHSRGQDDEDIGPEEFLANRKGYTVADAASVFDRSFKRDDLIECGCNMHARRKFVVALDGGDQRAALPIAGFKKLYEIEAKIHDVDDDERLAVRDEESRPVYDALVHWCEVYAEEERPTSPLGKAVRYLLNHQDALKRFLEDGRVPLDNGEAERLHVRAALTRKNFLFAGSDEGARRAAIAYTILGSCRLAEVNPAEYLADVLPKLARGVRAKEAAALLPAAWRAHREAEGAQADAAE